MTEDRLNNGLQRVGMFAELPTVLRGMNIDPTPLFNAVGIDVAAVTPAMRLTISQLSEVLERSAETSGCDHIGLLCGLRFRLEHHGIIGELMRTAPTLRHALIDYVTWQPRYSSSAIVYLHRTGSDYAWGFGIYAPSGTNTAPLYDCIVGVGLRMLQLLTGKELSADEVLLSHRRPRDHSVYAQLLGAPVHFDQLQSCFILSEGKLRSPLPGADPMTHDTLVQAIRADGRWAGMDWRARTRHELRRSLLSETPRMASIADELGLSVRTLRRRLAEEDTTFETLLEEVRCTASKELLQLTDIPISEIGPALGFASSKIFAESFKMWTGTTPSAWRTSMKSPADNLATS